MTPLQSLVAAGTKLWLDSVDPDEIARNRALGATGATSNPIIIADLVKTGRFDADMKQLLKAGQDDEAIAWAMTDKLVKARPGRVRAGLDRNAGATTAAVSFELDPLLEDPARNVPVAERTKKYIELGKKWAAGHKNRMIKVPATAGRPGGAGRTGRGRGERERHADLQRAAVRRSPATPCWRGIQRRTDKQHGQDRLQHLRQPAGRVHREGTCRTCRPRPRGRSGS